MNGPVSGDAIHGVERIDLCGFRGWTGEHSVALGADVVLVSAANGRGKSSLIEALSRVLNGAAFHEDGDNAALRAEGMWRLAVKADGREIPSDDPDWRQRLDHERTDVPEPDVLRRATVFRQDRLDEQFEGGPGGSHATLLSFVAPFPDWLRDYQKAIEAVERRWRSEKPDVEPAQAVPSARRRREQAAADAVRAIAPLVGTAAPAETGAVEQLARLAHLATDRDADPREVDDAVVEQRRWCEALRARQLDEAVAERLRASMDAVMRHFVVAGLEGEPGSVHVHVDAIRAVRPGLADERSLDTHASTGQKAQLALAVLLGSNALLQHWLPHRLLLLDDVSTALDLTNLAAECALLRKFAYTADGARRRQVVIASHHDQLTHRMFDLLLPPGDYTMREIRITDWSIDRGPTVQTSMIRATGAANDESRRKLGVRLGSGFAAPRSPRSRP